MLINCINLKKRTDRKKAAIEQFEAESCEYRFWDGVEGKIPKQNIHHAFKRIIQHYKDNKIMECCVAEDDIKFCAPGAWKYFLSKIPPQYDLYVSGYYSGSHDENFIVKGFRGMTLIIVAGHFYDTFLSLTETQHIDGALAMSGAKIITCYPFAAIQTPGFSDQRKRFADDSHRLKNKELYGCQ